MAQWHEHSRARSVAAPRTREQSYTGPENPVHPEPLENPTRRVPLLLVNGYGRPQGDASIHAMYGPSFFEFTWPFTPRYPGGSKTEASS